MKREIKYRGRTGGGVWLYGFPLIWADGTTYILHSENCAQEFSKTEVIPDTVGQFTGLQDKNGENIYEGDIVRWDDCSNGKHFRIALVKINPDIQFDCSLNLSYKGMVSSSDACFSYGNFRYKDTHNYIEVIGNIHCKLT